MVVDLAQPDVTLLLDSSGVIREASVSKLLSEESVDGWLGQSWKSTVPDFVEEKVRRIIDDTRESGVSAFRQISQRFPSGREVPIEYTTVLLGGRAGFLALGKSLVAVAELQARFVATQQTLEREYWKTREIETRYRLVFENASDAVMLVRAGSMRIVEANPAAFEALGLNSATFDAAGGADLAAFVPPDEWAGVSTMIQRVLDHGQAPGILTHLGAQRRPWLARATTYKNEPGLLVMLQLVSTGPLPAKASVPSTPSSLSVEAIMHELPDGFVLLEEEGSIRQSNRAFARMVDMGSSGLVAGKRLERWVWRPGSDVQVLLKLLREHRVVRLFPTTLRSELGTEMQIEISGAVLPEQKPGLFGLLIREVGRRETSPARSASTTSLIDSIAEPVGRVPLRQLIRSTVDEVERHYVREALDLCRGNRTSAAEMLGLSRQTLYVKLERYGLDEGLPAAMEPLDASVE